MPAPRPDEARQIAREHAREELGYAVDVVETEIEERPGGHVWVLVEDARPASPMGRFAIVADAFGRVVADAEPEFRFRELFGHGKEACDV